MKLESHEGARQLLRAARVEGISDKERQWLDAHLAGCAECSGEAAVLAAAIDSLQALSRDTGPEVVRRTSAAVHRRAGEIRVKREHAVPLWTAVAASSVWAIITTPYVWSTFAWLGHELYLGDTVWQVGFLMWWFLPATAFGCIAAWRHQMNWENL